MWCNTGLRFEPATSCVRVLNLGLSRCPLLETAVFAPMKKLIYIALVFLAFTTTNVKADFEYDTSIRERDFYITPHEADEEENEAGTDKRKGRQFRLNFEYDAVGKADFTKHKYKH